MNDLLSIIDKISGKYTVIARFLISGGSSFGVNIVSLYILKEYIKIDLWLAVPFAFMIAFIVSFLMMKHVTFQNKGLGQTHKQLVAYLGIALFNLALNSFLVLFFALSVHYIIAQIISSLSIAVWSFFIYKYFVFIEPSTFTVIKL